jgi:hypothetical protein
LLRELGQAKDHLKLFASSDKSYSILADHYRTAIKEVGTLDNLL